MEDAENSGGGLCAAVFSGEAPGFWAGGGGVLSEGGIPSFTAGDSGSGDDGWGGTCPAFAAGISSGEMEVRERVRERARAKEVSVEILMGSLKVEARRGRGDGARSGEDEGERVVGELPFDKRLEATGGL